MKTIRLFVMLSLLAVGINSCDDEKEETKTLTKKELLTNNSSKKWKVSEISPDDDDDHLSCRLESVRNTDNFYIFSADGSFRFDNGEIVEDPTCTEDDDSCCSDIADLYGTWQFYDNEAKLRVSIVGRIDGVVKTEFDDEDKLDLFAATITTLTAELLHLTQTEGSMKLVPAP